MAQKDTRRKGRRYKIKLTKDAAFSQLGIPTKALALAMVADIIFGVFTPALNQALLQTELILQADKAGMLDIETLRE